MPKRSRNPSIEIKDFELNVITFEWEGKDYVIHGDESIKNMISNTEFDCEVIHNQKHQAMLNVEHVRTGETILRQEINPAKHKKTDKWMEDI